jgi:photosystem II stability/assembly factor-like uncharacterized protein
MSLTNRNTGLKLSSFIGAYGWYLYRTSDGGNDWTSAMSSFGQTFLTADIHPSGFSLAIDESQTLFISTDSGETWVEGPSISNAPYLEASVVIADEQRAYIILDRRELLETTDQGHTWNESDAPIKSVQHTSFLESGVGVNGDNGLQLTRDAGATWQRLGPVPFEINGIHLHDSLDILIVGDNGKSALSADLGRSWEISEPVTSNNLLACRIIDRSHCVAVGELGSVVYGTITPPTSIENVQSWASDCQLHQNFPNPFNPSTTIEFGIPSPGDVRLTVFDHLGREVAVLADGEYQAGTHTCHFDAEDYATGMYVCRLTWNGTSISRKMALIR